MSRVEFAISAFIDTLPEHLSDATAVIVAEAARRNFSTLGLLNCRQQRRWFSLLANKTAGTVDSDICRAASQVFSAKLMFLAEREEESREQLEDCWYLVETVPRLAAALRPVLRD